MRLGLIAAIAFIALSLGFVYGAAENNAAVPTEVEAAMENTMVATKVIEEGDWGNFITLLAAPFTYFDSLVTISWSVFDTSLWEEGPWAIVPYFLIVPFVMVLFFGLIIILIGILQKTF